MRFTFFDEAAITEIINSREYQSTEFEKSTLLAEAFKGRVPQMRLSEALHAVKVGDGCFFLHSLVQSDNFVVFDNEEMPTLLNLAPSDLLLVYQKTLRFCKKLFDGLSPSKHERILSDTKAVIFPYPIGLQTSIRLTIERQPDGKRWAKRETGRALLIYKFGESEGNGVNESPRLTNFRRAVDQRSEAYKLVKERIDNERNSLTAQSNSLSITELVNSPSHARMESGIEGWRRWLTSNQLKFVESPLTAPHRIEGPAGTGKTLSLALKVIHNLSRAVASSQPHRALFVAHSQATKSAIENLIFANGGEPFIAANLHSPQPQSVEVTTLHELCASLLQQKIASVELIDRDAYESKLTQKLYISMALDKAMDFEYPSHKDYLSPSFCDFLVKTDRWALSEMIQHEISVQIKGRANEDLDAYKKLSPLKYGLPLQITADKEFIFLVYDAYQQSLEASAQFDTDDVVLSANSQLSTPIWRRRRAREGFDSIYIDETHLFNINELTIFHKLTRSENQQPIAYSVDRAQALGDRGWTDSEFESAVDPQRIAQHLSAIDVKSIFRCSPDIIDLAFAITSSGATLFTNFHNPLQAAISAFSAEEERKSRKPRYISYINDEAMLVDAFVQADSIAKELAAPRAEVAIVIFGEELFKSAQSFVANTRRPVELVKSRGDQDAVNRARQGGKYVLSSPEFVGGLEFGAVILVGVDAGRVPPLASGTNESQSFLDYASLQRLYVSVTRAKYQVVILGNKARGASPALGSAISSGLLDIIVDGSTA
jgi:superfamily I DNA/RNA helicase